MKSTSVKLLELWYSQICSGSRNSSLNFPSFLCLFLTSRSIDTFHDLQEYKLKLKLRLKITNSRNKHIQKAILLKFLSKGKFFFRTVFEFVRYLTHCGFSW